MNIKIVLIIASLMAFDYFLGPDRSELVYCWKYDYLPKCERS